jgi:hypothetical protein
VRHPGRDEYRSPVIPYRAFVDPSGGRHDSFTLGITHKEKDTAVIHLGSGMGTVV